METIYGHFEDKQIADYKVILHKELFWLLLYKDPETKEKYEHIDFEKYFDFLMRQIDGLNDMLMYPAQVVKLMSLLQAALIETRNEFFEYRVYRKLILDAHRLVDEIWEVIEDDKFSDL